MKLKKGRRQCQDILVVLVLLQHSPTMRQGELALIGDAGDGWCVFPHSYHRVQDKASPPPGPLALPGVHFCVADLMLSLSPFCADEATCISGTGQLLQGWWLSTPSLGASLSVLGFRNPTEQAVGKQQSAGNRGQSHGLGACVPSAVALGSISCCWCLLLPPQAGHVGVVAATPLPHPPHAFPCPCSQPEARLQAGKHGSVTCPVLRELDGHPSYSPLGEMAWMEPSWTVIWCSQKESWRGSSSIHVTHGNTSMGDFQNPLSF